MKKLLKVHLPKASKKSLKVKLASNSIPLLESQTKLHKTQ